MKLLILAAALLGVGFQQRIGQRLPLTGIYRNADGQTQRLGDSFGHGPVVLVFGYSRCPQLCSIIADGAVQTLRKVRESAGTDYQVVYVSIDPTDTPVEMRALERRDQNEYARPGTDAGWHYLCTDDATIHQLAAAAGFHYTYDSRQQLYGHASGFLVATPDGRISRYFLGIEYSARDVADALDRARRGGIGEPVFELLLVCARGLGITGRYGQIAWEALQAAMIATVLTLGGGIAWMLRQERRRRS